MDVAKQGMETSQMDCLGVNMVSYSLLCGTLKTVDVVSDINYGCVTGAKISLRRNEAHGKKHINSIYMIILCEWCIFTLNDLRTQSRTALVMATKKRRELQEWTNQGTDTVVQHYKRRGLVEWSIAPSVRWYRVTRLMYKPHMGFIHFPREYKLIKENTVINVIPLKRLSFHRRKYYRHKTIN